jgi:hypothetical protein
MPSSLPTAPDILAVVREFLETQIVPAVADDQRFNVRVAVNLLATVERELLLGPAADAAEAVRLAGLTGIEGPLAENNRRIAEAIRRGDLAFDDPQLLDHLRSTVKDSLRINNPKWLVDT